MSSEAQVTANRRNAKKSTGPRTTEGKAAVAQNAITHGLLARRDVITGEDPQAFDLCREKLLAELVPGGMMESILAERIVSLTWRLKRAQCLQNEVFDYLLAAELKDSLKGFFDELLPEDKARMLSSPDLDPHMAVGRAVERDYRHERVLDRLLMYERRIENSLYRTLSELKKLRLTRDQRGEGVPPLRREAILASPCRDPMPPGCAVQGQDALATPHGQTSLPVPPGDSAKQSQLPSTEGQPEQLVETQHLASPPTRSATEEPTRADSDPSCETKPIEPAESVCHVPVETFAETHNVASLRGVATDEAKRAKQSQSARSATGTRTVPRPRARVAWHSHNVPRAY